METFNLVFFTRLLVLHVTALAGVYIFSRAQEPSFEAKIKPTQPVATTHSVPRENPRPPASHQKPGVKSSKVHPHP